ncbi:MAG: hypothetical protein DRI54_02415, partial [Bacteroidetes bacterium]
MVRKNLIWFSELDPEYLGKSALLNKLQKDSKLEIKNIRFCFEPQRRPETIKSVRSKKDNDPANATLTYEAPPEMLFRESYYADGVMAIKELFF